MFKTIIFDLDDTILDFKKAEAVALSKTLKQQGIEPTEKIVNRYSEINASMWKRLENGELTRAQVLVMRFEKLFSELSVDCSAKQTKMIYEQNLSVGHYFIVGAYEVLERLYDKYDLYLASNGTLSVQTGRIESSSIKKFFKAIFISEQIGFVKPQKEFFESCFSKIDGFKKEETIIIGDSLSSDILGGNNVGIKTCWFNPNFQNNNTNAKADFEIHKLDEIYNIL